MDSLLADPAPQSRMDRQVRHMQFVALTERRNVAAQAFLETVKLGPVFRAAPSPGRADQPAPARKDDPTVETSLAPVAATETD
jgi:hypothetical protein